jgi:hypothetical protein
MLVALRHCKCSPEAGHICLKRKGIGFALLQSRRLMRHLFPQFCYFSPKARLLVAHELASPQRKQLLLPALKQPSCRVKLCQHILPLASNP